MARQTRQKKDGAQTVRFHICAAGCSQNYQHVFGVKPIQFKDGWFETTDTETIEHLRERHWCEEVR